MFDLEIISEGTLVKFFIVTDETQVEKQPWKIVYEVINED